MLDIKQIRQDPGAVKEALRNKNEDPAQVDAILELDEQRRELIRTSDERKALRNNLSKEIAALMAQKKKEEASPKIALSKQTGEEIKALDEQLKSVESAQESLLLALPNLPDSRTPVGEDETQNVEIRTWGTPRTFDFEPKPHWELGTGLEMMDFERASKLSGSRFVILTAKLARLNRALVQFMLDLHTMQHGYVEINIPHLVKRETMLTSGQLPKFEEEAYKTTPDDMFLVPTAEVFLASLHSGEILEEKQLPLKYVAYSSCFRREAGSYGKDVRGMIRVHQFEKVELFKFTTPESSFEELEALTNDAEKVLQLLELPYRVVNLCSGDTGFGAAFTHDLEVWLPSYAAYKEISSCSNDTDFQARRGNTRFRNRENHLQFPHTLNGSGLAVGRTLVALLENYQLPDGSIQVPPVLVPYLNGIDRIF
ncbi:MAG TPA: serine--tRNA ligase [Thermotogota bacterium]|nr:serine--tRNA ligase [Thermotogota bacterium]HRW91483.1 serine--tRNA ligase [Thermotogota bacterium]